MADTGAPWNIPYQEPADIVRDYPAASEATALAIAAGLTAAGNPGIGSNVVQTIKTDTFTSTSTSFVAITGLSATITPSSTSSKVLIIAQVSACGEGSLDDGGSFKITGGNTASYIGDAVGSRLRVVASTGNGANEMNTYTMVYLDSPSTDVATTYQVEGITNLDAYYVNRTRIDTNSALYGRGASSITVIEVAA